MLLDVYYAILGSFFGGLALFAGIMGYSGEHPIIAMVLLFLLAASLKKTKNWDTLNKLPYLRVYIGTLIYFIIFGTIIVFFNEASLPLRGVLELTSLILISSVVYSMFLFVSKKYQHTA